jgi:hypothetical protein
VERELLKYKRLLTKADDLISEAEHRLNTVIGLQLQLEEANGPPSRTKVALDADNHRDMKDRIND